MSVDSGARATLRHLWTARWLVAAALCCVSCTSSADVLEDLRLGRDEGGWVEGVPFIPQEPDTCGAAALASVLAQLGVDVSEQTLAEALRVRQRQGTITYELALEARNYGVLAVQRYDVMPEVLMRAIDAGVAPIILRGNLLHVALNRYHYDVLTAYDRTRRVWIAHDGSQADVMFSFEKLEEDHARADRWVLFLTSTEQSPEGLPSDIHLEWGVQAEAIGALQAAEHHYAEAAWSDDAAQALLNLSNLSLARDDVPRTITWLEAALLLAPRSPSVMNNLAWALLESSGDLARAEQLAQQASQDPEVGPYAADTLRQIREAAQSSAPVKAPPPSN